MERLSETTLAIRRRSTRVRSGRASAAGVRRIPRRAVDDDVPGSLCIDAVPDMHTGRTDAIPIARRAALDLRVREGGTRHDSVRSCSVGNRNIVTGCAAIGGRTVAPRHHRHPAVAAAIRLRPSRVRRSTRPNRPEDHRSAGQRLNRLREPWTQPTGTFHDDGGSFAYISWRCKSRLDGVASADLPLRVLGNVCMPPLPHQHPAGGRT
jgi:hypothetical protein